MPRMGGAEVFEAIQRTHPEIPIIILTGYSEDHVIDDLKNKRPAGFIQKPFEVKQLIDALRRVT
jgi:DNA-binding NarL/FixJ family response regulator